MFKKLVQMGIQKVRGKGKVFPTIKSVKPTKDISGSVKRVYSEGYTKNIRDLDKAEGKIKTGKEMIKEGQKSRKKMIDTKRAFQFKHGKSTHAIKPGEDPNVKYKGNVREQKPEKRVYSGKELEQQEYFNKGKGREKKMGGGMMGRRMGYSQGKLAGNQKKIDVAAPFGTINEKDFAKLRAKKKSGKRMQAKDGTGPEQFMRSGVKEDPMRDQMKQPLKLKRSKALMLEDLKKSKFKKRKP